ncbi:MAG: hypothetical protein KatS3mg095_0721 [Candidatus Parcubacteria bacterium]|nr:MAG: hypothetical protein KatS3mg095_0721 [Candidatus Parcubacteria bacterium]
MKKAEELQEEIFKKMQPEEKLKLWAGLFLLAKELVGEKLIYYDEKIKRPKKITRRNRKNHR